MDAGSEPTYAEKIRVPPWDSLMAFVLQYKYQDYY